MGKYGYEIRFDNFLKIVKSLPGDPMEMRILKPHLPSYIFRLPSKNMGIYGYSTKKFFTSIMGIGLPFLQFNARFSRKTWAFMGVFSLKISRLLPFS